MVRRFNSGVYKNRNDKVLELIGNFMREHLPANFNLVVDLPESDYVFPSDVAILT